MLKVLVQKQRAPLPPEGTWTYEEQQLWVLVGQSWIENPEERYEIRKIKNFLKDLVCDKSIEGPQGGSPSPSPSPETDSASEAARDLDRVRIWLDGELDGLSTPLVGRTVSSFFLGPALPITILISRRHPAQEEVQRLAKLTQDIADSMHMTIRHPTTPLQVILEGGRSSLWGISQRDLRN